LLGEGFGNYNIPCPDPLTTIVKGKIWMALPNRRREHHGGGLDVFSEDSGGFDVDEILRKDL
jgi:hypothetical protein